MGSLTPVEIAVLIVAVLAMVGFIIARVRSRIIFSGYEEIAAEVKRFSRAISGEVVRAGSDLVVEGTHRDVPVMARFSNAETTPGVLIHMPAPTTFQLSVAHLSTQIGQSGRMLVRTGNEMFDARFATRTDHPTEARLFLRPAVTSLLQKLACSNNTFLIIGSGAIELSELVTPLPNTSAHLLEHLRAMAELFTALGAMPGADRVSVVAVHHERHLAGRIAIAVGVVVALGVIFAATRAPKRASFYDVNASVASGIPPAEAQLLRNAPAWRVATADDFDPIAAAWLRSQGRKPEGRIKADFFGRGEADDVAYLLIGPEGRRRIAILANHANALDGEMVDVALIARIPQSAVANIEWKGQKPPEDMLGDGLLVVQRHGDSYTSVVFFLSHAGTVSGAPVDYQQISLP